MNLARIVAITLPALLVAACGAEEAVKPAGRSPAAILASALERSESVESYRSSFRVKSDFEGERLAVSGTVISNADSSRLRGDFTYAEGTDEPFEFEMILIEDEGFVRGGPLEGALPKGKQWMRMQDDSLTQQSLTPRQFVELLRNTPQVEENGREIVRGEPTVRLRGPLDLRRVAEKVGDGPVADLVRRQPGLLDRMNATVEAWIADKGDRLLRNTLSLTFDGDVKGRLDLVGDVLEEGVGLEEVEPPADRLVIDEKELTKG